MIYDEYLSRANTYGLADQYSRPAYKIAMNAMVDCGNGMNRAFDIGVESLGGSLGDGLTPDGAARPLPSLRPLSTLSPLLPDPSSEVISKDSSVDAGTFYLETFGCQMNDHDSEKVAGLLLARGYRQVESRKRHGDFV